MSREGFEVLSNIFCWNFVRSSSCSEGTLLSLEIMLLAVIGRKQRTDLCPYHLCQCTNELRSCICVQPQCFFVDDFPNGEPEGSFEALEEKLVGS